MLNVFIGYDDSETIAAQVLAHSIRARASKPVAITFLMREQLRYIHKRKRHPLQSTAFAFTRFLVPHLSRESGGGHSIFMDCDFLVLDDIHNVLTQTDKLFAPVSVVKHDHQPTETQKMLGQVQTTYPRKNWSSFMLFWADHYDCVHLTPELVDTADGLSLHQFEWVNAEIGTLPGKWNHLIGYDDDTTPVEDISCLHWTSGGPWWDSYRNAPYADVWFEEKENMLKAYERVKAA